MTDESIHLWEIEIEIKEGISNCTSQVPFLTLPTTFILSCVLRYTLLMGNKLSQIFTGWRRGEQTSDRLTQLPDDVLWSIMSSFTVKEAAVTSLVSHKWNTRVWRSFRRLKFEDSRAMARIQDDGKLISQERSTFVQGVNSVVEGHQGETIDEFTVSFDLDISCQSYVNKWVGFALDRQVKRLNLDLLRNGYIPPISCVLPLKCCLSLERSHNLSGFKHPLTSLCLKNVDVTTQVVDLFLRSCPHLENLSIQNSKFLDIIRVSGTSLPLKHLTVHSCENMKIIDISVPKLLSFRYRSCENMEIVDTSIFKRIPLKYINLSKLEELHIRDAFSLQLLLFQCGEETLSANLDSLSNHFSLLEYLSLTIYSSSKLPLGVHRFDTLSNLKHLELTVIGSREESVLAWIPLIEASPILEKLTLKMASRPLATSRCQGLAQVTGRPLRSLKTLDIRDLLGSSLERQLVHYVVENAIMLQEVIVHVCCLIRHQNHVEELVRALRVEDISPSGAKLIYKGWGSLSSKLKS